MVILRKRGNVRLELSAAVGDMPAVAVIVSPIGQADIDVALGAVATGIVKAEDAFAPLARYGVSGGDNAADALRAALRLGDAMLAIELGIRHIVGWEGVGIDDETPAPVEPATVAMLFNEWAPAAGADPRESYGSRFMRRINGLSTLEPAAKKDSVA